MSDTAARLEALLFFLSEPVPYAELAQSSGLTNEEITAGLDELAQVLETNNSGMRLVRTEESAALVTAPVAVDIIERLRRAQAEKPLGRAGIETLSIVLYHGPVTRADIDYIRGVNSTFILRTLAIRGLVDRTSADGRTYTYTPSAELLAHLGITSVRELPDYESIQADIAECIAADSTEEDHA